MEILPDCTANGARDSDVVLESRQAPLDRLGYQPRHHCSALDPKAPVIQKLQVVGRISDNKTSKSTVADQDVGAEAEDEVVDSEVSGGGNSPCQIVGGCSIVEQIGWTADPECGVLSERLVTFEPLAVESINQLPVGLRAGFSRI